MTLPVNGITQCGPYIWLIVNHIMFLKLIHVGVVEFIHYFKMFSHMTDIPLNGHTTVFTSFLDGSHLGAFLSGITVLRQVFL